jgi:hypothetical protein
MSLMRVRVSAVMREGTVVGEWWGEEKTKGGELDEEKDAYAFLVSPRKMQLSPTTVLSLR